MKTKHKRSTRKKYLITGLIGLLILAIGLTVFVLSKDHISKEKPGSNTTSEDFVMVTTTGLSYRATIQRTYDSAQQESVMIMDREGTQGASRLTRKVDGVPTATVYYGETTYSCNRQSCQKINQSDSAEQLAYDFSMDAIRRLTRRVVYQGEAPCPAGTCQVWDALPDDTTPQYSQKLYIDKRTKSVSKVVRTYKDYGYKDTITYDYSPQSFTLPPLPQETPIL